jgi:pantetheine-phosphate adenylyltransferase
VKALFPGTFDPLTLGHLDLIERAVALGDELVIAVVEEPGKGVPSFSLKERVAMIEAVTNHLSGVTVAPFGGLAVDFAKQVGASHLIRGLRTASDFESEFRMGLANRKISGLETVYLLTDPSLAHISSTLIREIGRCGKSLADFVPEKIVAQVEGHLKRL